MSNGVNTVEMWREAASYVKPETVIKWQVGLQALLVMGVEGFSGPSEDRQRRKSHSDHLLEAEVSRQKNIYQVSRFSTTLRITAMKGSSLSEPGAVWQGR
jgi:hypothetical protein